MHMQRGGERGATKGGATKGRCSTGGPQRCHAWHEKRGRDPYPFWLKKAPESSGMVKLSSPDPLPDRIRLDLEEVAIFHFSTELKPSRHLIEPDLNFEGLKERFSLNSSARMNRWRQAASGDALLECIDFFCSIEENQTPGRPDLATPLEDDADFLSVEDWKTIRGSAQLWGLYICCDMESIENGILEDDLRLRLQHMPGSFLCPISTSVMKDHVATVDGAVYDRQYISPIAPGGAAQGIAAGGAPPQGGQESNTNTIMTGMDQGH